MRLVALLPALLLTACGTCQQVKSMKENFRAEAPESPPGPHIRLEVPDGMVTKWLDAGIKAIPSGSMELPGLGDLSRYLGNFGIEARSIAMQADVDDGVRFEIDFDFKDGRKTLFGLEMAAKAPVRFDRKTGKLRVALRADMFEKVKPRLAAGAEDKLVAALYGKVPGIARAVISRSSVKNLVNRAMSQIVDRAYTLIRDRMLKPVGEITAFQIKMPDVPLAGIALRSVKGKALSIDVRSTLAAGGLSSKSSRVTGNNVRMNVSTDFMAALGNWAMSKGKLPKTYNREGKPSKTGQFTAGLDWRKGAKPMKVHMWSLQEASQMCIGARAGATPRVEWKKGELKVGFKDATIEEITGPPLLQAAVSIMGISDQAFAFTQKIATKTELSFGKGASKVSLRSVKLDSAALSLELALGGGPRS